MEGVIEVYKDWSADEPPQRLGTLRVHSGRTGELFDFTFDDDALTDSALSKQTLDPDLGIFPGPQFPKDGRAIFGVFKDSRRRAVGSKTTRITMIRQQTSGFACYLLPAPRLAVLDQRQLSSTPKEISG